MKQFLKTWWPLIGYQIIIITSTIMHGTNVISRHYDCIITIVASAILLVILLRDFFKTA